MKIYKYPLGKRPTDYLIDAPIIELLGVFLDPQGEPCLYAVVEPDAEHNTDDDVIIHVFWTGYDLPHLVPYWRYLTTLQVDGLMCHYFVSGRVTPV